MLLRNVRCQALQYAEYLDSYAKVLDIPVQTFSLVKSAAKDPKTGRWLVKVLDMRSGITEEFTCKHLVIANGLYNDPVIPNTPGRDTFKGLQVHSSRYTNGTELGFVELAHIFLSFYN